MCNTCNCCNVCGCVRRALNNLFCMEDFPRDRGCRCGYFNRERDEYYARQYGLYPYERRRNTP